MDEDHNPVADEEGQPTDHEDEGDSPDAEVPPAAEAQDADLEREHAPPDDNWGFSMPSYSASFSTPSEAGSAPIFPPHAP